MNPFRRLARGASKRFNAFMDGWDDLGQLGLHGFSQSHKTTAGISVSPSSALGLTAVFSAINCISTDVASLPIGVYQRRKDGGRDEVRHHNAKELLNVSPDGETTAMRMRQAWLGHALGWGNGCAEIEFDGSGNPFALYLLDAVTRAERDRETKRLQYRLRDNSTLAPRYVAHVAGFGYDGLSGYCPITLQRQAVGLAQAAETFGAALFGNGAIPRGVITTPKVLKEAGIERLRAMFNKVHQGSANAHNVAILEEGAAWVNTQISPEDAQFLATRAFQILEIARMFRVPPHKIGDYSQAHLANLEESNLDYMMTTLMPWCEQVEQVLNFKLFTPQDRAKGLFVEHNLMAFLRGNMQARADFYTKLRDLGVMTPNMIARFENLNPIGEEGDIRLVPLNMTSLANAGKPTPADPKATTPNNRHIYQEAPANAAA